MKKLAHEEMEREIYDNRTRQSLLFLEILPLIILCDKRIAKSFNPSFLNNHALPRGVLFDSN